MKQIKRATTRGEFVAHTAAAADSGGQRPRPHLVPYAGLRKHARSSYRGGVDWANIDFVRLLRVHRLFKGELVAEA